MVVSGDDRFLGLAIRTGALCALRSEAGKPCNRTHYLVCNDNGYRLLDLATGESVEI